MKLQFWSVGKPHDINFKNAVEDYSRRIKKYFDVVWIIIPPVKNAASFSADELKKQEEKILSAKLKKDDFLVLLDENGTQFTSVQLADFISKKATAGERNIVFLIGGAFGVSEAIKQRSDFTWSLSKLVFPHMLVRLILAEQIYRACTILHNEKYHHQ